MSNSESDKEYVMKVLHHETLVELRNIKDTIIICFVVLYIVIGIVFFR